MDFPGGLFVGSPTFLALCLGTLKFHPLLVFRECFSWPPKNLSFFGPRSDFWVLVGSTHLGKILRDMVIFPLRLVTFPRYFCFPMYPVTFESNLLCELKASIFAGLTQPRCFFLDLCERDLYFTVYEAIISVFLSSCERKVACSRLDSPSLKDFNVIEWFKILILLANRMI